MKVNNFPTHLRVAIFPYVNDWKPVELRKNEIESSMFHGFLLQLLTESLKFSFELKNNTKFGHHPRDGIRPGCIGMVQREEADIAVCALSRTDIESGLTFSIPYLYTPVSFLTDKPQPVPNKFAIFYSFSWHLWMALTISLVLMSIFFFYFFGRKYNYPYVSFQVFASLLEQSFHLKLRSVSGRVLVISWIIGAMCITYSYKAVLLASISFPNFVGIHTIKELSEEVVQNPSFKCGAYAPNELLRQRLNNPKVESFMNIYNCMKRTPKPWDPKGFTLNSSYKKAYLNINYYLTEYKKYMYKSEDSFYPEMFAVPVSKRFCCVDELNNGIYRLIETGLIEKYLSEREFFMTRQVNSTGNNNSPNRILTLDDLFGAFMVLIGGLMLSTFVFVLEIIFRKSSKLKKISGNFSTVGREKKKKTSFKNVTRSYSEKSSAKMLQNRKKCKVSH